MSYLLEADVAEDLAEAGCPVCRGAARAARRSARGLMRDDMTDPSVRATVEAAGGLCARHVLVAVEVAEEAGDTLGLTLLSELLLIAARPNVAAARRHLALRLPRVRLRRGKATPAPGPVLPQGPCVVCEAEARVAVAYIDILAGTDGAGPLEGAGAEAAPTLCLPHLALALDHLASGPAAGHLARAWLEAADRLATRLEAGLRGHAHDQRGTSTPDMDAAIETAHWLAGWPAGHD